MLNLENAEYPDDPFILFNLGWTYRELGRIVEALPLLRRSLALSHPTDSIVRKLFALIAQCHRQQGQPEEALAACREGRRHYPDDLELLFEEGCLLLERGDLVGAEQCLTGMVAQHTAEHFASIDPSLRGYRARHLLAVVYQGQGRLADAEAQWRAALDERPDFGPALQGMGEICMAQARWPELEEWARRLETDARHKMEAILLRARGLLARQERVGARCLLEEAASSDPQALAPRILLLRLLGQEDRSPAAVQVAQEILILNPDNAEARRFLHTVRHQESP